MSEQQEKQVWGESLTAPEVLWADALAPGRIVFRGDRAGHLIDKDGKVYGSFHRSASHHGWSVWTTPYAGFVYPRELEVVANPATEEGDLRYEPTTKEEGR